jgi:isoleucyl-tRNA synthetase
VVDLGGFYLDVIKDRLYTTRTDSEPRRSAQTALYWIAEGLTRWLAPILSFTAEEIWRHMPGERTESVFHTTWVELPATGRGRVAVDWPAVLEVRSVVLRELERLRIEGRIGAPLDAVVDLYCAPERRAALAVLGDELRFLLITSEARVHVAEDRPAAASAGGGEGEDAFWVSVDASSAAKCVRCWHKREDVGHSDRHPQLCARCVTNIEGPGEQRRFA